MKYSLIIFLLALVSVGCFHKLKLQAKKSQTTFSGNQILNMLYGCQYDVSPTTRCCSAGMLFNISNQAILNGPVWNVQDQAYNAYRRLWLPSGSPYNYVLSITDQSLLKQISDVFVSGNLQQFSNIGPLNINGTSFTYIVDPSNPNANTKASFSNTKRVLSICRGNLSTNYLLVTLGINGVSWKNVQDCCTSTIGSYPLSN